jgi:hypothetical protein
LKKNNAEIKSHFDSEIIKLNNINEKTKQCDILQTDKDSKILESNKNDIETEIIMTPKNVKHKTKRQNKKDSNKNKKALQDNTKDDEFSRLNTIIRKHEDENRNLREELDIMKNDKDQLIKNISKAYKNKNKEIFNLKKLNEQKT